MGLLSLGGWDVAIAGGSLVVQADRNSCFPVFALTGTLVRIVILHDSVHRGHICLDGGERQ